MNQCTQKEILDLSEMIRTINEENLFERITTLQSHGLKIYHKNEPWYPVSNNFCGYKMIASDYSVCFSLYVKKQISITKEYANLFEGEYFKYNLLIKVTSLPEFIHQLCDDCHSKKITAETFDGPGKGTSGIFLEFRKDEKRIRIPISLKEESQ